MSSNIHTLPEDCVSAILSFTSPADASMFCSVSPSLRSPALSDLLWLSFLPSDYPDLLSRAVTPLVFSSKRDLFFALSSRPLLIDGGSKSFQLDKSSGKKSYIFSATELSLMQENDPVSWNWTPVPESRFSVVAHLRTASRLEIKCEIRTGILTPNTLYGAYLIMKVCDGAYGLDSAASEVTVEVGDMVMKKGKAYLSERDERKKKMEKLFYGNRREMLTGSSAKEEDEKYASRREDGWLEIELGDFYSGEEDQDVKMGVREVGYQLKAGLIVQGIHVRPKS